MPSITSLVLYMEFLIALSSTALPFLTIMFFEMRQTFSQVKLLAFFKNINSYSVHSSYSGLWIILTQIQKFSCITRDIHSSLYWFIYKYFWGIVAIYESIYTKSSRFYLIFIFKIILKIFVTLLRQKNFCWYQGTICLLYHILSVITTIKIKKMSWVWRNLFQRKQHSLHMLNNLFFEY